MQYKNEACIGSTTAVHRCFSAPHLHATIHRPTSAPARRQHHTATPPAGSGSGSRGHGRNAVRPLPGIRKAMQSLVASDNGENNKLEPFNEGRNVAVLQQLYNGIITDPGRFLEPPQARPCFFELSSWWWLMIVLKSSLRVSLHCAMCCLSVGAQLLAACICMFFVQLFCMKVVRETGKLLSNWTAAQLSNCASMPAAAHSSQLVCGTAQRCAVRNADQIMGECPHACCPSCHSRHRHAARHQRTVLLLALAAQRTARLGSASAAHSRSCLQ